MSLNSIIASVDKEYLAAERFQRCALAAQTNFSTMMVGCGGLMLGTGIGMYVQNQTSLRNVAVATVLGVASGAVIATFAHGLTYIQSRSDARLERMYGTSNK